MLLSFLLLVTAKKSEMGQNFLIFLHKLTRLGILQVSCVSQDDLFIDCQQFLQVSGVNEVRREISFVNYLLHCQPLIENLLIIDADFL